MVEICANVKRKLVNELPDETLASALGKQWSALFLCKVNTVRTGTRTELVEVVVAVVVSVVADVVELKSPVHPDLHLLSVYLTDIVPQVGREEAPSNY